MRSDQAFVATVRHGMHNDEQEIYDRIVRCMKATTPGNEQENLNPVHMNAPRNLKEALAVGSATDWYDVGDGTHLYHTDARTSTYGMVAAPSYTYLFH